LRFGETKDRREIGQSVIKRGGGVEARQSPISLRNKGHERHAAKHGKSLTRESAGEKKRKIGLE